MKKNIFVATLQKFKKKLNLKKKSVDL